MRTVEEHQRGISFRTSVEALKDAVPLDEYALDLTDLRGAGGNLVGLCPLHDEKTPSFKVYPDGHFHCYGCGAHGDVLDLHQLHHGYVEKWEALVSLAMERGVELPGRSGRWHEAFARKAEIRDVAARVAGQVYKRRAFRLLVWPEIEPAFSGLDPEERRAEFWRAYREFGSPERWERYAAEVLGRGMRA